MNTKIISTSDAIQCLESLSSRQIEERLDALDREQQALRLLLRAARLRERRAADSESGVRHE